MEKMLFTSPQPEVTIKILPDRKRDVTVLTDEEEIWEAENEMANIAESGEAAEDVPIGYRYTGNQFRTNYPLTEEDVQEDLEKYLDYQAIGEPPIDFLDRDQDIINQAIDDYTMELIEEGLL